MDRSDWTPDVVKRFENGRFISSKDYSKVTDAGYIERLSPRRFTRHGRIIMLKVVVNEHTSVSGRLSRELHNRSEFIINLRDSDCEELLDGVLRITYNDSQRLLLFPANYYNFREWKSWFAMTSPPARFNSKHYPRE